MLEVELTNRLYREEFIKAPGKIALLPYCLQDFTVNCKSEKAGFDYQCRHCSAKCFQNHASMILKANNIEPFIWSGSNMKKLAGHTPGEKRTFGVPGIACVPELTFGMRSCRSKGILVVGIPLNANRCIQTVMQSLQTSKIDIPCPIFKSLHNRFSPSPCSPALAGLSWFKTWLFVNVFFQIFLFNFISLF